MKRDLQPSAQITASPDTGRAPSQDLHGPLDATGRATLKTSRFRSAIAGFRSFEEEDLQQRVELFLASSSIPALRHLSVVVEANTVSLHGQVQTYYEKQLAVEFSRRVAGVIHVVDLIDVRGYAPRKEVGHSGQWRRTRLEPSPLG